MTKYRVQPINMIRFLKANPEKLFGFVKGNPVIVRRLKSKEVVK